MIYPIDYEVGHKNWYKTKLIQLMAQEEKKRRGDASEVDRC